MGVKVSLIIQKLIEAYSKQYKEDNDASIKPQDALFDYDNPIEVTITPEEKEYVASMLKGYLSKQGIEYDVNSIEIVDGKLVYNDETLQIGNEIGEDEEEEFVSLSVDEFLESAAEYENAYDVNETNTTPDLDSGRFAIKKDDIDGYSTKYELRRDMYKDEDILAILDEDNDGELSDSEKAKFESYVKHKIGNGSSKLQLDDLKEALKQIKDEEFDLEDYKSYEIPESEKVEDTKHSANDNGTSSANASSGGGGSYSPASNPASYENMSLEKLESLKPEKEQAVNDALADLEKVIQGQDEEIQKAQSDLKTSQEAYLKALEADESIEQDLKDKIKANFDNIEIKEKEVADFEVKQLEIEAQIDAQNSVISQDQATIDGYQAAIENCKSQSYDTSDPEQKTAQQEMQNKIAELEALKAEAESKKAKDEEQLANLQETKAEIEESLKTKQDELNDLQATRTDLEQQVAQNTSSKDTKEALEACQEQQKTLDKTKAEQKEAVKKAHEAAKADLAELNEQINRKTAIQIENENSPKPTFDSLMEMLTPLVGMSEGQISQLLREEGTGYHNGLYCADFVAYALAKLFGKDNTPLDYLNTAHTPSCPGMHSWAVKNGMWNTDINKVQPGDAVIFGSEGSYDHTGIVISVNSDGTVNTIEGNGVGGYVVSRQHVRGVGYLSFGQYMSH